MKIYLIGILSGLILALAGWAIYEKNKPAPKSDVQVIERIITDKQKVDSLLLVNARKDSTLRKSAKKLAVLRSDNQQKEDSLAKLLAYAYALEEQAALLHQPACDSAIKAKNVVIDKQDQLITGLKTETKEYNVQVSILNEQRMTDSLIIFRQAYTINELSCAYKWKIKHRFWAWIFGWKCRDIGGEKN